MLHLPDVIYYTSRKYIRVVMTSKSMKIKNCLLIRIAYPVHEHTDLRFYAAPLNSRILNFYYKIMSMEHGRALPQTDIDFLLQLPHGKNVKYRGII